MSQQQIFYYSRRKLGYYLLFNLGLMSLALLFTWIIFPEYKLIYYFALITCSLSILSALISFLAKFSAVTINDDGIKIDHNKLLKWSQIKKVEKICTAKHLFAKEFLKITPQKITGYKMSFMQALNTHSGFGAFSIPLYAMEEKDAKKVEKLIKEHTSEPKKPAKTLAKKAPAFKKTTKKASAKKKK